MVTAFKLIDCAYFPLLNLTVRQSAQEEEDAVTDEAEKTKKNILIFRGKPV